MVFQAVPNQATCVTLKSTVIDWSTSSYFKATLSANIAFTFTNQVAGQTIFVDLLNTTKNWLATFPTTVKWANGVKPTSTPGNVHDAYTLTFNGTDTLGSVIQNMS